MLIKYNDLNIKTNVSCFKENFNQSENWKAKLHNEKQKIKVKV